MPWALYGGLALTTASMLLIQQFLTRIFTIQFNSGLAFLAISITFLGLGSAGVAIYVLPRAFEPQRIPRMLSWLALAYAIFLVAGFLGLLALDRSAQAGASGTEPPLSTQVIQVLGASLAMLPALFTVGLVIALLLRAHSARVNRLYGADLVGGSAGCLLVLPLMRWIGGDQGIFAIAAMAAAGSALLAHAHGIRVTRTVAGVTTLLLLAAPLANRNRQIVDVRSHRTTLDDVSGWVVEDQELGRRWNELARLSFFQTGWRDSIYVRIDSSCQTTIPATSPEMVARYLARTDVERLPFALNHHDRYLELGAGGGQGMVLADALGSKRIVGVEINRDIVSSSLHGFPGFGVTPLIEKGQRDLVEDEGRSWSRRTDERFDAVTITFIQTRAANSSAAFALSEANLFTVEAFKEFLSKLDPAGGVFYVFRQGGNEVLRLVSMAREALAPLGVTDVRPHLYAARRKSNHAVVLISPAPFSDLEVAQLDKACDELGLDILYTPSGRTAKRPPNPLVDRLRDLRAQGKLTMAAVVDNYHALVHSPDYQSLEETYIRSEDPAQFLDDYPVDVRAPTDGRPYFFFYGLDDWRDWSLYFDLDGVGILGGTVILLFWMAAAFSMLVGLLIFLPLALRRGERAPLSTGLAVVAYFAGLGLGYIAVQISFIQRFTLFLGHPVFAISVVLMAFLLSSGLGSISSDRLFRRGWLTIPRAVIALALVLVLYNVLLPAVFHSGLIGLPVAARVLISVLLIFPLAFLMGLLFPQGIRLVDAASPQLTPWAWGANSATSVVGSIFALIAAIHLGFSSAALIGALAYCVLCLPRAAVLRRAAAS